MEPTAPGGSSFSIPISPAWMKVGMRMGGGPQTAVRITLWTQAGRQAAHTGTRTYELLPQLRGT